jgi:hypothetical protein
MQGDHDERWYKLLVEYGSVPLFRVIVTKPGKFIW